MVIVTFQYSNILITKANEMHYFSNLSW